MTEIGKMITGDIFCRAGKAFSHASMLFFIPPTAS